MVRLLFQVLAVAGAATLVSALFARAGQRIRFPQAAAIAILLFFAILAVEGMRESWRGIDEQRKVNAGQTRESAIQACSAVGVDLQFLDYIGRNVPLGERYLLEFRGGTVGGEICARMLLLPRLATDNLDRARYVVFFGTVPPARLAEVKARGATITRWSRDNLLARLP